MSKMSEAVGEAAQKTEQALAKDFSPGLHDFLKDTEHKTGQVAENAAKTESEHVRTLEELRGRMHDKETPVYRLRDDRVVERLTADGPRALTQEDRDRLGLQLDKKDRVRKRPKGDKSPYNLPDKGKDEERPLLDHSTQVPLGSTDLAEATQLARHEDKSYGNYSKDGFTLNNYAAVRYGKKGDADSFILVGRSRSPVHSERILGIPFKQAGTEGGLTELYTERAPCSTGVNCSAWMRHFLPSSVAVSHSVEYGASDASQKAGNAIMEHYVNRLWPKAPRKGYVGAG
ncbi:hypothetical protein DN069_14975 [Streptacidiphilus pinicola]|uniref:Nucleic acid/nucleotide deaminase of polymorphic system toxin n=1 Tax=Streptacidiphilus pinicola TaxID=2219663 RepID=A0A2X0JBB5_9ACTN|nr:nucleic acid/nucleotide deaminase domain-containing protein [Streptacidiphilus pinicola]RAG84838.1 hypothetical protein DN069_14975 [Streptacidiphilus pinicola]